MLKVALCDFSAHKQEALVNEKDWNIHGNKFMKWNVLNFGPLHSLCSALVFVIKGTLLMSRVTEEMTNCIEWMPHHELILSYNNYKLNQAFLLTLMKLFLSFFVVVCTYHGKSGNGKHKFSLFSGWTLIIFSLVLAIFSIWICLWCWQSNSDRIKSWEVKQIFCKIW